MPETKASCRLFIQRVVLKNGSWEGEKTGKEVPRNRVPRMCAKCLAVSHFLESKKSPVKKWELLPDCLWEAGPRVVAGASVETHRTKAEHNWNRKHLLFSLEMSLFRRRDEGVWC